MFHLKSFYFPHSLRLWRTNLLRRKKHPIPTVFNSILIPFLWDHKHFSKRREKPSLYSPHNLSTFPPRCSLRLDISQASHQFLFVLHCLEKPSGKRKEKGKKYNPDDMSCTSWHSCHRPPPPFPYNVLVCVGGIHVSHSFDREFLGVISWEQIFSPLIQRQGII